MLPRSSTLLEGSWLGLRWEQLWVDFCLMLVKKQNWKVEKAG